MKDVTLDKAQIVAVELRSTKGTITSKIKIVAQATAKIARALEVPWLLDREALIKGGFEAVELDLELKNVRVKHEVERIPKKLDVYAEQVDHFKIIRKGDDKKKSKRLLVSFVVHSAGSLFDLIEYMYLIGAGDGVCVLMPVQTEMAFPEITLAATQATLSELAGSVTYGDGGWTAAVQVKEVKDGYAMTRKAMSPNKRLVQVPPKVYASEAEARQAGATDVKKWADKIAAGGTRPEKKEAAKVAEWAAGLITMALLDTAQGTAN